MTTKMKRFQSQVEASNAHIRTLRWLIGGLVLLSCFMYYGWKSAPESMTVHIPPDLRRSATMQVGHVPPENVFMFASHIFPLLHRWQENGDEDYRSNIYKMQYFLTPRYQRWLDRDYQRKFSRGELRDKERAAHSIPGHDYEPNRVVPLSNNAWIVFLDLEIQELVGGLQTKKVAIRYPLRVVRMDVDRENNPWGLGIDGYPDGEKPRRLEAPELASADSKGRKG